MKLLAAMLAVLVTGPWLPTAAADDRVLASGPALINACAACHGPDGQSQGAIPAIDNLSTEAFIAALKAFRTGARQGTAMNRIAKGIDDAEIDAMAAYIAGRRGLSR